MGVLLVALFAALVPSAGLAPTCYVPPVSVPIADPFVGPACDYCPGHRGVEYDTAPGTVVRAGSAGVVTFAGVVAGTRYVVVLDEQGLSATYGALGTARVRLDERVDVGDVIGSSTERLYFGLRRGDTYVDPADHLGIARRRPRLVPSSGRPGRPAMTLPATCRAG